MGVDTKHFLLAEVIASPRAGCSCKILIVKSFKKTLLRTERMEIQKELKKMTLGHEIGAGAMCLKCKDKCEGFELHFWRKICRNCKCSLEDHDVQMKSAESKKVGKLFEDTKYTGLIAKLKTDGIPAYKGNTVTLSSTGPVNDVGKTTTFEWAPPVANRHLVARYMELLPPEKRPVVGSQGAEYRKRQMAKQLPEHDQEPSRCHDLTPGEVKLMQQYVRKCKDEALGVGDLKLPEELVGGITQSEGKVDPGAKTESHLKKASSSEPEQACKGIISTTGSTGGPGSSGGGSLDRIYFCYQCNQQMKKGDPAVYADRAGYENLWHPACFVCCICTELLVDMIYFWKKGKLYCGRHYGESEKPRCGGCDELIFSNEYTQAEGLNWHLKHFCCFDCDLVLAGETYVMEKDHPVCKVCYMKNYAMICVACKNPIEPEAQRVSYGESHWHAEPQCFQCSGCSKCLIGQRFMAMKSMLFCSVECKKTLL